MINDGPHNPLTFPALLDKKHLNLKYTKMHGRFEPPCVQVQLP